MQNSTNPKHSTSSKKIVLSDIPLINFLTVVSAYIIVGKLTNLLTIPHAYSTVIWPSAGIALAATILYGYRIWPAIFVGAFTVNLSNALDYGLGLEVSTLFATCLIGLGAALQALAGKKLVCCFAGFPNLLSSGKEVLLFFLFGALLSTVVSPTIGMLALISLGKIAASNLLSNWSTWWLGDAMGVLLFTPIILAWTLNPRSLWQKRRFFITLPTLTIFLITIFTVIYESENENKELKLEFEKQANIFKVEIEKSIETDINILYLLESFYVASDKISRNQFKSFVARSISNIEGVKALGWNPKVTASERVAFESNVKLEGYNTYQIKDWPENKKTQLSGVHPEYLPVCFIEPYKGNENAMGYDMYSNDTRREAINRARDNGEVSITAKVALVQAQGKSNGVIAFMPIYIKGRAHETLKDRRANILGYMVEVLNTENLVPTNLKNIYQDRLTYQLVDITNPKNNTPLFKSDVTKPVQITIPKNNIFVNNDLFKSKSIITVGGRQWSLQITPSSKYLESQSSQNKRITFLIGLFLTCMTGIFSLTLSGRGTQLSLLADERTALINSLKSYQENLESTVAERTQELKLTMHKLRLSEERYELTIDAVNVGLFDWDIKTNEVYVNNTYFTMLGYQINELNQDAKSCWIDLLHPDEKDSVLEQTNQMLKVNNKNEIEFRMRGKDGHYRWITARHKVVERDLFGVASRLVGTHTDNTLRKSSEIELMHNEEDLKAIFTQSPDGIVIFDENLLVSQVNDLFCFLTGYSQKSLIGNKVSEFNTKMKNICAENTISSVEFNWNKNSSDIFKTTEHNSKITRDANSSNYIKIIKPNYRILQYTLIELNHKRISYLIRFRDITAETEVDRMKSEFLSIAAHELRTPMTIILGYIELLNLRAYDKETVAAMLKNIHEQSQSIVVLLDELLDLARIESLAGRAFNKQLVPLAPLIENLGQNFMMVGDTRKVKVLALPVIPDLFIDQEKIKQALKNCLSNAFKYSSKDTEVSIEVGVVDTLEKSEVTIFIQDHGIGMSPEQLSHLFEKFYRADTSGQISGTGLGMSLVKEIIDHHSGQVDVESSPCGTLIKISLPIPNNLTPKITG